MTTLDISAPEFVRRYQSGEIPPGARVTVTYEESPAAPSDPALALVEEWLSLAPTDPAEIRDAEADLQEVQEGLDATRKQAGARMLYPSVEPS